MRHSTNSQSHDEHSSHLPSYEKKNKVTVSQKINVNTQSQNLAGDLVTSTHNREILPGVFFLSVIFEGQLAAHRAGRMAAQQTAQERPKSMERAL